MLLVILFPLSLTIHGCFLIPFLLSFDIHHRVCAFLSIIEIIFILATFISYLWRGRWSIQCVFFLLAIASLSAAWCLFLGFLFFSIDHCVCVLLSIIEIICTSFYSCWCVVGWFSMWCVTGMLNVIVTADYLIICCFHVIGRTQRAVVRLCGCGLIIHWIIQLSERVTLISLR